MIPTTKMVVVGAKPTNVLTDPEGTLIPATLENWIVWAGGNRTLSSEKPYNGNDTLKVVTSDQVGSGVFATTTLNSSQPSIIYALVWIPNGTTITIGFGGESAVKQEYTGNVS